LAINLNAPATPASAPAAAAATRLAPPPLLKPPSLEARGLAPPPAGVSAPTPRVTSSRIEDEQAAFLSKLQGAQVDESEDEDDLTDFDTIGSVADSEDDIDAEIRKQDELGETPISIHDDYDNDDEFDDDDEFDVEAVLKETQEDLSDIKNLMKAEI